MPAIGLPERARYLAVSAETPGTGIENLPAPGQFLRRAGVPSAWRLRADEQVGVVAVSQDRRALAIRDLLARVATGRGGISPEYDDALDTDRALGIAAVARRCLPPGSIGVATVLSTTSGMPCRCATCASSSISQTLPAGLPTLSQ